MPAPLTDDQNERVRRIVQNELLPRYEGNVSRAAEEVGMSQPMLSRFLRGLSGTSFASAERIAKAVGKPTHEILGMPASPATITYAELPNWREALTEARRISAGKYTRDVWEAVGKLSVPPMPRRAEVVDLLSVAEFLFARMNR